jgi:hypothetical protein
MSTNAQKYRISLPLSEMSDAEVVAQVAAIQKLAPTSPLMKSAAVAASVTAVGTKAATFTTSLGAVSADEQQLRDDRGARNAARTLLEGELGTLMALVVNTASGTGDLTGMGFVPATKAPRLRTVPPAPSLVIARPEKAHGRARVSVQDAGSRNWKYLAEATPDPVSATSVWSVLAGTGKQRTLTGPTGTRSWVRFAQVRDGLQSDWSTPVLVTLP